MTYRTVAYGLKCLLIGSIFSHALHTYADFYEIEMTVFSNDDPRAASEQTWPSNIKVQYPEKNLASLSHKPIEDIYPELIKPNLPPAIPYLVPLLDKRMDKHNDSVSKILQNKYFHVLSKNTWLMKIESKEFSKHVIIQDGKESAGVFELGGTVRLYTTPSPDNLPPSIHINTKLWRLQFGNTPNTLGLWPIPETWGINDEGATRVTLLETPNIARIALLNSDEIISRNTLHYIDHPLFSVLIEIRPYNGIQLSE